MSGPTDLLMDTNAVIAMFAGNLMLQKLAEDASWVGISIVTYIEFRSSPRLSEADAELFNTFLNDDEVIGLSDTNDTLISRIIEIRRAKQLKLPDAIVVATALDRGAAIATADEQIHRSNLVRCIGF